MQEALRAVGQLECIRHGTGLLGQLKAALWVSASVHVQDLEQHYITLRYVTEQDVPAITLITLAVITPSTAYSAFCASWQQPWMVVANSSCMT